jgi:hypothetical protein
MPGPDGWPVASVHARAITFDCGDEAVADAFLRCLGFGQI